MSKGLIYIHVNTVNGKFYIGQTITTLRRRLQAHINEAKREGNTGSYFHRALNKYGTEVWKSFVLEDNISLNNLDIREEYYICKYNTYCAGYNMTLGGSSGKGQIVTAETRAKLSKAGLGRRVSETVRKKISEANKGSQNRLGHTNSANHREKISKSRIGTKNPGFKPWAITKPDGTYEVYRNKTKKEYAEENGLPVKAFSTRFGKDKCGKPGKAGPFKNWIMENLND